MATTLQDRVDSVNVGSDGPDFVDALFKYAAFVPQILHGLLPRTSHRVSQVVIGRKADNARGLELFGLSWAGLFIGFTVFLATYLVAIALLSVWAFTFPTLVQSLADRGIIESDSGWLSLTPARALMQIGIALLLTYAAGLFVRAPYDSFARPLLALRGILWFREVVARLTGMVLLMGFGLLPLASLLMFLPVVMPEEAVLRDTVPAARSRLDRLGRRLGAIAAGVTLLVALLAFATQLVSWMGLKSTVYEELAKKVLPAGVLERLPAAMVAGWPFVFLLVYATDFFLLFRIGKVPLQYNLRNLRVRWITTAMTGVAFTVVVFLLILMMSFVDSVNRLTENTGVPGNVFVLSEGSTDELFSNLGYGDVGKLELEKATTAPDGRNLLAPIAVKTLPPKPGQSPTRLCSRETYFVISQEVAGKNGGKSRIRFAQLRGIDDAEIAGKVHDVSLIKGEWFGREGSVALADGTTAVPCVLGEGAASAWGDDYGKARLDVGDKFKLGDLMMVVCGVMKSAGKTFDSETWATNARVSKEFGKQSFTTVVLRVADDNPETLAQSTETFAYHISKNFANPRVRAVSETRYYQDLAKSNTQLMTMVVTVAVIMALGGVIGVMLVMFAAIAQRIKDIGVMRVVGYKRWQILVSFMIESLAIALIGGLFGVFLILVVNGVMSAVGDGLSVSSQITSGQGSAKSVVTKLYFGYDILFSGILFSIVMGRLGGLLPSINAMRLGILESLR